MWPHWEVTAKSVFGGPDRRFSFQERGKRSAAQPSCSRTGRPCASWLTAVLAPTVPTEQSDELLECVESLSRGSSLLCLALGLQPSPPCSMGFLERVYFCGVHCPSDLMAQMSLFRMPSLLPAWSRWPHRLLSQTRSY